MEGTRSYLPFNFGTTMSAFSFPSQCTNEKGSVRSTVIRIYELGLDRLRQIGFYLLLMQKKWTNRTNYSFIHDLFFLSFPILSITSKSIMYFSIINVMYFYSCIPVFIYNILYSMYDFELWIFLILLLMILFHIYIYIYLPQIITL